MNLVVNFRHCVSKYCIPSGNFQSRQKHAIFDYVYRVLALRCKTLRVVESGSLQLHLTHGN